jgi:hypothetical protein
MKIGSVFISHSSREPDYALSAELADFLGEIGIDVWWDVGGLEGGDFFPVEILEAIIRQNFFIFVMSENSISSRWCLRELIRATELGKDVKPLLLGAIPPERSPLELAGLQHVDIRHGLTNEAKANILRALGIGHAVPIQQHTEDPFARDGNLIAVLAEQLNYAKTFTDTLNMVLLLEHVGRACCETDRARLILAGMRTDANNWVGGRINYDRVRDYLLNSWRGS